MIIAIDGLAVNGKTTLAKRIANSIGFKYFSAGAIYRCIALTIINKGLDINNIEDTVKELEKMKIDFQGEKTYLDGIDVSKTMREEEISIKSTEWGAMPEIKAVVRNIQRKFIKENNTVMEGRDIGTRIAPNADVRFYLYSEFQTRVGRIHKQRNIKIEEAEKHLAQIDDMDLNDGNFIKPVGAIEIDTTNLSLDEVYQTMMNSINRVLDRKNKEESR